MARSTDNPDIRVKFSVKDIISAVKELEPEKKEQFIENLLAATSPEYLESVREAREDYRAGRVSTHEEAFGKGARK